MAKQGATDPIALAAGPMASLLYRGGRQVMTGKATPKSMQPGANAPAIDQIDGMKNEAYQLADELGVTYSPDSFANLIAKVENRLIAEGMDPDLHRKAYANLRRLQARVGDQPMTMQQIDQLRQLTRRDVVQSSLEAGERRMGMMVIDDIDDFIADGANAMNNGQAGADAIQRARSLNSVWRKSQALQDAVENAQLRSASTGSGGNFENALRQEIRKIYQNPKKVAGFSEAERAAMRKVIEGDTVQNLLRGYGKLSPVGSGLMSAIGVGAAAAHPYTMPVFLGAIGAKHLAQRGVKNSFNELDQLVRSGATASPMKNVTPGSGGPAPQNAFDPTAKPVQSGPGAIAGPELGGAVIGGAAGATQGETLEERGRNAFTGAVSGALVGRAGRRVAGRAAPAAARTSDDIATNGLGSIRRNTQQASEQGFQRGSPSTRSEAYKKTIPQHSNEVDELQRLKALTAVVGVPLAGVAALFGYSNMQDLVNDENGPSLREVVQYFEEEIRSREGLPPRPTLKPASPQNAFAVVEGR
ncbi:MAG: hypothetical protein HRT82_17060 [Henriciella sp.]|nr:hypothetical protein [Henriciella sp.]